MPPSQHLKGLAPLTFLDQTSARMYIVFHCAFEINDRRLAIESLRAGVNTLFSACPILAGAVVLEQNGLNKYRIVAGTDVPDEDGCPFLQVKEHDCSTSTILIPPWPQGGGVDHRPPSYGVSSESFAPLVSVAPDGQRQPVLRFQANIMTDGLVLTMSLHHFFADGTGAGLVLEALGECCRCAPSPSSFLSHAVDKANLSLVSKLAQEETHLRERVLNTRGLYSDNAHVPNCRDKTPNATDKTSPLPPPSVPRKFMFPADRIRHLKTACNNLLPDARVSSNDVLTALLATAMHDTMEPRGPPSTTLMMAVDLRRRLSPPRYDSYLGNMATFLHVPITRLSSPLDVITRAMGSNRMSSHELQQIAEVALRIRQGLPTINEQFICNLIESKRDPTLSDWAPPSPFNIFISSWRHMRPYHVNFGPALGHIDAFEMNPVPVNGTVVVMPPQRGDHPLFEVNIALSDTKQFDALYKKWLFGLDCPN
ncbi:transferase family-domain-containing protein [Aspergillus crustosus]